MTAGETPCAPLRVDKWLWHARFFKTRSRAAEVVSAGHLRLNGQRVAKPAQQIRPGDVLTFPAARRILVIRVLALSERRGPAPEARLLYDDLTPPEPADPAAPQPRQGRPSREDRRTGRLSRQGSLE